MNEITAVPSRAGRARRERRRRSDGERTRSAILRETAQLATVEGIDGLSIGRLADAVGMSKSGLYAHFGSKEELQLATIDTARAVFDELVIDAASSAPTAIERLRLLCESYLRYAETAFPGGCFFASLSSEMDTHPGPVRDRAVQFMEEWMAELESAVRGAQAEGAVALGEDAAQLAFELEAYLILANLAFVMNRTREPLDRARRALERRLAEAAP